MNVVVIINYLLVLKKGYVVKKEIQDFNVYVVEVLIIVGNCNGMPVANF